MSGDWLEHMVVGVAALLEKGEEERGKAEREGGREGEREEGREEGREGEREEGRERKGEREDKNKGPKDIAFFGFFC